MLEWTNWSSFIDYNQPNAEWSNKEVIHLIPSFNKACVVKPPLKTTVTIAMISTAVSISWCTFPTVFRIASANATAPRRPITEVLACYNRTTIKTDTNNEKKINQYLHHEHPSATQIVRNNFTLK